MTCIGWGFSLDLCGTGSLVLGQNQDCYGGCFNPQFSFDGDLADVRIWDRVLTQVILSYHRTPQTMLQCSFQDDYQDLTWQLHNDSFLVFAGGLYWMTWKAGRV